MFQKAQHVIDVAEAQVLLEVVRLEQSDALLGHALVKFSGLAIDLVRLEKEVYDSAGAVVFLLIK